MGFNVDDLDEDVLAFLLDNEMDIQDKEFSRNAVAASTCNDQASIELTKALEEDQRPMLPAIAEKPKQRFKSLTIEKLRKIESKKQSSTDLYICSQCQKKSSLEIVLHRSTNQN